MMWRDFVAAGAGAAAATIIFWLMGASHTTPPASSSAATALTVGASATALSSPHAPEPDDQAWRNANANLARQVKVYQERLEQNETEKATITRELKAAKAKLAAAEHDGALPRNEFDVSQDDWKELAKTGTVKARYPCGFHQNWTMTPDAAVAMGLAPNDAPAVEAAVKRSENRIWQSVASSCAAIVGGKELAERLGTNVCIQIVSQAAKEGEADRQLVADVHAGNRPMPPFSQLDPYATVLMAEADAMQAMTDDLAQTFGPAEAKRIAFSDELGSCSGTTGGKPPAR
jgi:hypothetical protein